MYVVTYLVVVVIQVVAYTNTYLRLKQHYVRWKMEANGQNVHIYLQSQTELCEQGKMTSPTQGNKRKIHFCNC